MTPEELLKEIEYDVPYYGKEGGVTFSGGEPLMQRDFLRECIKLCKCRNIGTAVETSLAIYTALHQFSADTATLLRCR